MIAFSIVLLLIPCAFCTGFDIDNKCNKDEDFTLQKEILSQRDNAHNPCSNPYDFMCNRESKKKSLEDNLSNMTAYLMNILNQAPRIEDSELLKVEKKLYESCMDSDETDSELLKTELRNLKSIGKWQTVENKLFSLGFGYSFFDIKVIPHPEYESVNTILLQPPSLESIRSMVTRFNKIIDYKIQYRKQRYMPEAEPIYNLYEFLDESTEPKVLQFFDMLEKAKLGSSVGSIYSADFPEKYTTVKQFNSLQVHAYLKPDTSIKADWVQIIQESLRKMNITFDTDNIILKNPQYFLDLTMLLRDTPNNMTVTAIQTKSVTESLAYLDWDLYNSLEPTDKSKFCSEETKLYGASHTLVHDWVNEDDAKFNNFMKGENIVSNIISSIQNEISTYNETLAVFYKKKLHYVFESLKKYVYEPPYNLYDSLNVSSNIYFKNIIEYRKQLIHKDLEHLQDKYDLSRPFSFIDRDEPQNRFVINTLINIAEMFSPDLPKEVHYGTFGVRTAALIHALFQEDTFNDESASISTNKLVYPKYSEDTKYCIMHKLNIYNFGDNLDVIISHSLALKTTLDALKQDGSVPFHSISNSLLFHEKITPKKLFFLSYIKDNCYLHSQVLNSILIDDYSLNKAFSCGVNVQDVKTCMLR